MLANVTPLAGFASTFFDTMGAYACSSAIAAGASASTVFAYASTSARFASVFGSTVFAEEAAATCLALILLAPMFANARPSAVAAVVSHPAMLATPSSPAELAGKSLTRVLADLLASAGLAKRLHSPMTTAAGPAAWAAFATLSSMLAMPNAPRPDPDIGRYVRGAIPTPAKGRYEILLPRDSI